MKNKDHTNLVPEGVEMAIIITVLPLFVSIGALICIHFFCFRRGLIRNDGAMVERDSASMSRDEVEKLPCYDYMAKSKGSSPVDECAVCLGNFKKGEKCRLLPTCNHSFHAQCVDIWLLKSPNCPICRTDSRRFTEQSSRTSDTLMELSENNQSTESGELNDVRIELEESQQITQTGHATVLGAEPVRENQENITPLPDSTLEHV